VFMYVFLCVFWLHKIVYMCTVFVREWTLGWVGGIIFSPSLPLYHLTPPPPPYPPNPSPANNIFNPLPLQNPPVTSVSLLRDGGYLLRKYCCIRNVI
jgi:hypothetical protein